MPIYYMEHFPCVFIVSRSFFVVSGRFFFFSSHSHMRITVHPRFWNRSVISLSLWMFRFRFFCQYSAWSAGRVFRQSCPCQKQPSTKMAIRWSRKTKSGCPFTAYVLRQPVIWFSLKSLIIANSVLFVLRLFTERIIWERSSLLNTSLMVIDPSIKGNL